jgi:hypothetical protein
MIAFGGFGTPSGTTLGGLLMPLLGRPIMHTVILLAEIQQWLSSDATGSAKQR